MSSAPTYESLLLEVDRGVALVTLNRPEHLNAFNRRMTQDFFAALDELEADDDVRAIVVTGAGRAFCAGADLSEGFSGDDSGSGSGEDRRSAVDVRPWEMRTPVIAAINGAAVGMGLTYPLLWDIRIAAEDAKLGLVFTRRGLLPEGNSLWLLPRLVGASRALELLLTGRIFDGREAERIGLVTRAVPREAVLDTALDIAIDLAANTAPASVAIAKRLFYRYLEENDRMKARTEELEMFRWLAERPDAGEGVSSFRERRPPEWTMVSTTDLPW